MGETIEITQLVEEAQKLHHDLIEKVETLESRLTHQDKGLFSRLGLDIDKDEKHNLREMASRLADVDVAVQKLRRTRQHETEGGESFKDMPFFDDPVLEASWKARSTHGYRRALSRVLRKGERTFPLASEELQVLTFKTVPEGIAPEVKNALSTDFDQGAGFLAPPQIETEIDRVVLESSPLAQFAREVPVGSSRYEGLIRNANRDEVRQVGEREGRSKRTEVRRYDKLAIDVFESEAAPALTQTQIEDSVIDLVAELQSDAAEDFAIDEGRKLINGSGNEEPEGLMVSDRLLVMNSGATATFGMDAVKKLPQKLKVAYKARAAYGLSREALTEIMLFREDTGGPGTGAYLWQPSTQDGTPSRLNGYSWWEAVDMDPVGANTFPIVFGDFFQAYRIARRRGLRILRDDFTDKPNVVFFMTKRYGGRVWKGEAACKMKIAA